MLTSEHTVGERAVDGSDRPSPVLERDSPDRCALEPGGDIRPVPKRASDVAGGRARKVSRGASTTDAHGNRLTCPTCSFSDVSHGHQFVFDGDGLKPRLMISLRELSTASRNEGAARSKPMKWPRGPSSTDASSLTDSKTRSASSFDSGSRSRIRNANSSCHFSLLARANRRIIRVATSAFFGVLQTLSR